jgi:hypothetical protein
MILMLSSGKYDSKGAYFSSSLYVIINFGGVTPIFIPVVWQLLIPPRVHDYMFSSRFS